MPHQCLGCGRAFPQGSMELLKGCPGCKGTRFFYTETVLDDSARAAKANQTSGDLRSVLEALAREEKLDARSLLEGKSMDDWLALAGAESQAKGPAVAATATPRVPPAPAPAQGAETGAAGPTSADDGEDDDALAALDAALGASAPEDDASATAEEQPPAPEKPVGTVQVHEPGSYTLDVERLLAASPIVIEKEGVYMIHLASAFEAPPEGAAPARRKHGRA